MPRIDGKSVLEAMGYDSFLLNEDGVLNLAVYDSKNIKLYDDAHEATSINYRGGEKVVSKRKGLVKGSFDPSEPDIRYLPRVEKVIASSNFKNWFGDSKVVTEGGKPKVLYRGVRRKVKNGVFGLTQGRRTPSFSEVPEVANLYAHEPQMFGGVKPKGSVYPVFLKMENPMDIYEPELVRANLTEHIAKWGDDFYPQNAGKKGRWFDVHDMLGLLYDLESTGQTNAEVNWSSGLEAYQINSLREAYSKVQEMLDSYDPETGITTMENSYGDEIEISEDDFVYYIQDLADSIIVDQYSLADSSTMISYAKRNGYDGIIHADTIQGGAEYFPQETIAGKSALEVDGIVSVDEEGYPYNEYIDDDAIIKTYRPFEPNQIKSAIGNQSFDPDSRDLRYMPLVNLPGSKSVQYKQNNNLIPVVFDNISRIAGKHVTFVEADRHDTDLGRMGGPLHAFLKSNDVIVNVDGQNFRPQWANLTWKTMRGMIERVKMTDDGHALISIMKEDAHRSNKDMFSRVAESIESNRNKMSQAELEVVANIMSYAIKNGNTKIENPTKSQKNFAKAVGSYKSQLTRGKTENAQVLFDKLYKTYSKTDWWKDQLATDLMTDFRNGIDLGATFKARADISKIFMKNDAKSTNMPFIPDISALIHSEMDYHGAKLNDVVGVVQLSKHKLDSPDRVFAVYTGKDPTEASFMTNNEREALKQLQADPNFRVHPSYDWLMLGPGNADFFMLNKPVDPVGIMTKEFVNNHEMKWRDKVTKMESKLIERFGRTSAKRGDSKRVKSSFEKFEKERDKTPLPQQSKSNILGAFLRYEGGVPKVKK